jgi:Ca2+:H+ antiporter
VEGSVLKRKVNLFLFFIPLVLLIEPLKLDELLVDRLALSEDVVKAVLPYVVFSLSALSLIPLAGFVESAVEELAELLGPFIGGLLHTTFGNVAELFIGLSILLSGIPHASEIVLGSIGGVIVRNSLLGLGVSTIFGSWRNGRMKFDVENATEYSTVFVLAVVGLCLPTIVTLLPNAHAGGEGGESSLLLPGGIPLTVYLAIVLLLSYLAYLGFAVFRLGEGYNLVDFRKQRRLERLQRKQAKRGFVPSALATLPDTGALFEEERESAEQRLQATAQPGKRVYAKAGMLEHKKRMREARGERGLFHQYPVLRGLVAALVLGIATAGVVAMSEHFAESIESILKANADLQHYEFFLGLILIPVLTGVVELYGSISAARENRMEIAMAVTAGATIQMILLVVPILVIVGQTMGHPLDLVFKPLNIIIFCAATFIFMLLSRDGESTWLEGTQLSTLWLLIAVVALFLPPR